MLELDFTELEEEVTLEELLTIEEDDLAEDEEITFSAELELSTITAEEDSTITVSLVPDELGT